jgi:ATP-dependent DNA ligase
VDEETETLVDRTEDELKTLARLKMECQALGLEVNLDRTRPSKEPYLAALRDHHWQLDHPGEPIPSQLEPMLLGNWSDLDPQDAQRIENGPGWIVQPKLDGVRAIMHIESSGIRINSRCVSEVNYRLGEFQDNLPHLTTGLCGLEGTTLDGELVFPSQTLDTGKTLAQHPLQATMAILSTSPDQATRLQDRSETRLRFHAFDILKFRGQDLTQQSLLNRLERLAQAVVVSINPYLELVPTFTVGRLDIHHHIIEAGGEGTVWKKLDQCYEAGRRVNHWLKRKQEVKFEAFVTGFKPGKPGNGHENLIGALEFSVRQPDGSIRPIAWVSSWSDDERRAMTRTDNLGQVALNPSYLNRRAVIIGQDEAVRSGRLRHARLNCWLDRS